MPYRKRRVLVYRSVRGRERGVERVLFPAPPPMLCGHFTSTIRNICRLVKPCGLLASTKKKLLTKRKQDCAFNRTAHSGDEKVVEDVFYFRHRACCWMWRVLWCNDFWKDDFIPEWAWDKSRQDLHRFLTLYP
jgi:hypothetical protein